MTLTDLQKLAESDEGKDRIRVMVAEMMGWEPNGAGFWHKDGDVRAIEFVSCGGRGSDIYPLPLYPTSLDACAEFEAVLTESEKERYKNWLHEVCGVRIWGAFEAICAYALHRCMAFILTKTKGGE